MLEVPPEWNEVPDLMMEDEDVLPEDAGSTNRREMKLPEGGENSRRKIISGLRDMDIQPQCLEKYKIQRGLLQRLE